MPVHSDPHDIADGTPAPPRRRIRARVEGAVQGVGFRPYVYRLASSLGLSGFVRNDERGVLAELEGDPGSVDRFLDMLPASPPPLARIERVTSRSVPARGDGAFAIGLSETADTRPGARARLSPDVATCAACLAELADPGDRRYRYPFLNCTDCGPRFTIVRSLPYDRAATTMALFAMCAACRAEYEDPPSRRFHAQPNACAECGPRLELVDALGVPVPLDGSGEIAAVALALAAGAIVAVKGLGGFHLACRADHSDAVSRLRAGKRRPHKPFALMVTNLDAARKIAIPSRADEGLLASPRRPVVLVRRREGADVADEVAPGQNDLGLMLPYTPLHHLLTTGSGKPLVMTSGNRNGEPIALENEEALERLSEIADLFLMHDRPIHARADDSVARSVRVGGPATLVLRRSRGWVPEPLAMPVPATRPLLAVGGHLKNTFCLASGERAWLGPHVGDLSGWETLAAFRSALSKLTDLLGLEPAVVAHDLHPDYVSTAEACRYQDVERVGVQHHHAHMAGCLAEHGETGPALGAIFDGSGYGPDGTIWGGELLLGGLADVRRVGHLLPVRMPGGEAAVREPWRMACAWLVAALDDGDAVPSMPPGLVGEVEPFEWAAAVRMARTGFSAPETSSVGRLFDGVAALCGLHQRTTFEGQAAMALEAAAGTLDPPLPGYAIDLVDTHGACVIDPRPALRAIARDAAEGVPPGEISAGFHEALAQATARWCGRQAAWWGTTTVVLSGGVWQNVRLLERTAELMLERGLRVLIPRTVPPNDGGLAYGQAVVAAARTSGIRSR